MTRSTFSTHEDNIKALLVELSIADGTRVRINVATTLKFLQSHMPHLDRCQVQNFLICMDLHKEVALCSLKKDTTLAVYRRIGNSSSQSEDKSEIFFYTKAGTRNDTLGIDTTDREYMRYRVVKPSCTALLSRTTAVEPNFWNIRCNKSKPPKREAPKPIADGGGRQYMIPSSEAKEGLELIQWQENGKTLYRDKNGLTQIGGKQNLTQKQLDKLSRKVHAAEPRKSNEQTFGLSDLFD